MPKKIQGSSKLFESRHFHFEALRAMAYAPYGGADIGEVFSAIGDVKSEDGDSWYQAWYALAQRLEAKGEVINDKVGQGRAKLRAHNYYRTAEFFLSPSDKLNSNAYEKSCSLYYQALNDLNIPYSHLNVPYEGKELRAVYYPGSDSTDEKKPLLMACTGFDGTLEELYFFVVAPAIERGYSVLTYEGPGQCSALREDGLTFTDKWEKPTGAVIDAYTETYGAADSIVLFGVSLGGLLGARAAAFDARISGFIAWNSMYDFKRAAYGSIPAVAMKVINWLLSKNLNSMADRLMNAKASADIGVKWGLENGMWTFGCARPSQCFEAFEPYKLEGVSERITADVLLLWGEDDHFVDDYQLHAMQQHLPNAKSQETLSYSTEDGGQEHCQLGILTALHADVFDWVRRRFVECDTSVSLKKQSLEVID